MELAPMLYKTSTRLRASTAHHSEAPRVRLTSGEFWVDDPHAGLTWLRANDPPVPMMIDMDDPQHKQRRQLVYKGFIPRRVQVRRERLEAISHALVDRVCERGDVPDRYDDLLRWSDDLMRGQGHFDDPVAMGNMMTAFAQYAEYFAGVLADRKAAPRDDLISVLIDAEVDGDRLDDDSLLHESLLLLIGGDETTRHVISGGLFQMLASRDNWEQVRADRGLLPSAIEETRSPTTSLHSARVSTRSPRPWSAGCCPC
jgi:cholest-4-en-3-one 26-monooxygenase